MRGESCFLESKDVETWEEKYTYTSEDWILAGFETERLVALDFLFAPKEIGLSSTCCVVVTVIWTEL